MVCPGFAYFKDLEEQPSGPAAMEGTAAGELLERMLTGQPIGTQATNGVYFDDDMFFYVKPIADQILAKKVEVLCEQRIDWNTQAGVSIRGQYDLAYVHEDVLHIEDLKYGWGIVEVRENWQLLAYAIGEVIRRGRAFTKVRFTIHQPRPHHEDGASRSLEISYAELLEYKAKIEARCAEIVAGKGELTTSSKCRYCPAAAEACPAFNRVFYRGLEVSMAFTQDQMNDDELADVLDQANRASEAIKIRLDSLNELATSRMKSGRLIRGYVSEARYSDRRWKAGISPAVIQTLTGKDVTEKTMLSPAKAEKLGLPKDFVNALVDRTYLGQRVVKKNTGAMGDKIFGNPNQQQGVS